MKTMPVKSILPDDVLNFDDIESCKISGLDSSPPPISEDGLENGDSLEFDIQ